MFINKSTFIALSIFSHLSLSCPLHTSSPDSHASTLVRRSAPARQIKTAITNVRVFDGSCFTRPKTIFVDKGVFTDNGDGITTTIDGSGKYIIPGLIDSHIHISDIVGLENATSYGMTTAMNMACNNYTVCSLLKRQEGLADFLTASQPAVGPNSTHARFQNLPPSKLVTDASNATDLAQWAVGNGSDWFKITLEINGPSYDLTRRLISSVHDLGQQTMSHASDISAYKQAIDTGIDGIQHTPDDGNITVSMIRSMQAKKQFVTPTMTIHAFALDPPDPMILTFLRGRPTPGNSSWSNVVHNVRAMYRNGIPLLAGTDAVGPIAPNITLPFGDTLHGELQHFVEDVGMSPVEAINAATKVAAEYHRLGDRGRIKVGMRADFVLLNSDPLKNIRNTRDIVGVWVEGRKYAGPIAVNGNTSP
jgi:imidazolonepropionase-like amidohydrolase